MIYFLIGFYFGGAIATLFAIIAGGLTSEQARRNVMNNPVTAILIVIFWPYTILQTIYDVMD